MLVMRPVEPEQLSTTTKSRPVRGPDAEQPENARDASHQPDPQPTSFEGVLSRGEQNAGARKKQNT